MDEARKAELLKAAAQWETVADAAELMAKFDRDHGYDLSKPGESAGDHRAKQSRRCARTLRLEVETGQPHCMCHERPERDCPSGGGHGKLCICEECSSNAERA